jgi:hypothetical protein
MMRVVVVSGRIARLPSSRSTRQLFHTLASKCDEMTVHAFLQHVAASVSVALQAGNAAITFGGLQRLRVAQLS